MPFRETEKPFAIRSAPPTLGEHNREILGGLARAFRRGDRSAHARRHHRHRDADGGTARERKEAGGGLMAETRPAQRHGRADASAAPQALMSVRGLGIRFKTSQGVWQATRKIDFDIAPGERVGIVGESGCGKTITGLSILRLLPNNLAGLDGSILFDGVDLARCCSPREMRAIRGRRIAMIFQEPMSALDPVFTVGHQIAETLRVHTGDRQGGGEGAHPRHAAPGRHRLAGAAHRRLSAPALRRHAPARDDRGQPDLRAAAADRGRADHRARRHRAGADPGTAARPQRDLEHGADADHA